MLTCDKCHEHYTATPISVLGMTYTYLLCPLCAYELRQSADAFCNSTEKPGIRRPCGHIFAIIYQDRK
jgi:hypothetical protein